MNFVFVPEEVTRLLVGHNTKLLPPPSGGGQLQGWYHPQDSIVLQVKAAADAMLNRDADCRRENAANAEKVISVFRERAEDYQLSESFPARRFKLLARELNPKDGRVRSEWIWNRDAKDKNRMRLRGSRKQTAARMARKANTMDARVFNLPILNSQGEVVGWKAQRNENDFSVYQGLRMTNFETGMKYSGPPRKVKVAKERKEVEVVEANEPRVVKVADAPQAPRDEYEAAKLELKELEKRIRALLFAK